MKKFLITTTTLALLVAPVCAADLIVPVQVDPMTSQTAPVTTVVTAPDGEITETTTSSTFTAESSATVNGVPVPAGTVVPQNPLPTFSSLRIADDQPVQQPADMAATPDAVPQPDMAVSAPIQAEPPFFN